MTSKPRFRKVNSALGWQGADDPEWEFAQSSHMPLYAGAHAHDKSANVAATDEDREPLIDVDASSEIRFARQKPAQTGGGVLGHLTRDLRGDYGSIALLVFLYILQGVPLGLTASIPLVLQNRKIGYSQQAIFSFAYWPFSLKLFWAPLVDSCYWPKLGRRKSWLVPTQYLIGLFMFVLSFCVSGILGDDSDGHPPNVLYITSIFFMFNFLAATQDIAVDGWALTMLSKRNVGYASTCNAVGQTAGYFLGNVVFLALESSEFCNKYLRSQPKPYGIVTLADFCYYWAIIFVIATTLVLLLKKETDEVNNKDAPTLVKHDDIKSSSLANHADDLSLSDTYKILYQIVKLKPVIALTIIHLTAKFAFAAADGITGLKLVELGVPKDQLAFIAVPLVPLQILLPIVIGKYTAGPTPLSIYIKAYPFRIFMGLVFAVIVYITPSFQQSDGHYPFSYFLMIIFVYCFHQITVYSIFVAIMAFHAQISDPLVGGTYMTLLNTISNLGGNWPVTCVLSIVDWLTWKRCVDPTNPDLDVGDCSKSCTETGRQCQTTVDGYYILSIFCAAVGILWWRLARRTIDRLQRLNKTDWTLKRDS